MPDTLSPRISRRVEKAKTRNARHQDQTPMGLSHRRLNILVNKCFRVIRKKRPKHTDYYALVHHHVIHENVEHDIVGYLAEKKAFDNLLSHLLSSNLVKNNFSEKDARTYLKKEIFTKRYLVDKIPKEKLLNEIISYFSTLHEWEVIYPLLNINISTQFHLGKHRLVMFTEHQRRKWSRRISNYYSKNGWLVARDLSLKWFEKDYNTFLKNNCCVLISISAGGSQAALEKSKIEFRQFFDIFKFLVSQYYRNYVDYRILPPGEKYSGWASYIGYSSTGGSTGQYKNIAPRTVEITKHVKEQILPRRIDKIHHILKMDATKHSEFEENILRSAVLYGQAMEQTDLNLSFMLLVTVLELNLVRRDEAITRNLSERLALIAWRQHAFRIDYERRIRQLYEIRGKVVHGG